MEEDKAVAYWKTNLKVIIITLAVWALVSYFFGIILAPAFNSVYIGQVPMGFWWATQGSMFVFVILIFVYSKIMDNVDQKYDVHEE